MPNIVFNFADGNAQTTYPDGTFTIKDFLTHNGVSITRDNQIQCQKKFNKAAANGEMVKSKQGNQSAYTLTTTTTVKDQVIQETTNEPTPSPEYLANVAKAKEASETYYNSGNVTMTDAEYDKLETTIQQQEKESGYVSPNSPTVNVGAVAAGHLAKVSHPIPMLSLNKTKDVNEINRLVGGNLNYIAMPKFDGNAVQLRYDKDGNFYQAVTRGNGKEGADVTEHAKRFNNIPLTISGWNAPDGGELWINGEAMITEDNAKEARATCTVKEDKDKPLRNLASGFLKRLDNTHSHLMSFFPVRVVKGRYAPDLWGDLVRLKKLAGFNVYAKKTLITGGVTSETQQQLDTYAEHFKNLGIAIDGIVFTYGNYEMAESMGTTSKFPKHSIAFKFQDETAETTITNIAYQVGVHGGITPVAEFKPVELEDTEVSRATLNNVSFHKKLGCGVGDKIVVQKANQIIPQVVTALTRKGTVGNIAECPVCDTTTQNVYTDSELTDVVCTNYDCPARIKARLLALAGKSGLDVIGVGEKFIDTLYADNVRTPVELVKWLVMPSNPNAKMPKSITKVRTGAVKKFKEADLARLLTGMCIPSVGASLASDIANCCEPNYDSIATFINSQGFDRLDGVGETITQTVRTWFNDYGHTLQTVLDTGILSFPIPAAKVELPADAPTVVITGTFSIPRAELSVQLGDLGFRVQGACSKSTRFLLAGDNTGATKVAKANKLGIAIVDSVDRLLELSGK